MRFQSQKKFETFEAKITSVRNTMTYKTQKVTAQLSSAQLSSAQLSSAQLSSAQLSVLPRSDKGVVCLENLSFFEAPEHIKAQSETRFQRGLDWVFDFYAKSRCRYS